MQMIEDATQSVSASQNPRRRRKWILFSVIVFVCAVVGAGLYFSNLPVVTSLYQAVPPPTVQYRHPSAGFAMKYPFTWEYLEQGGGDSGYTITFAPVKFGADEPLAWPQDNYIWVMVIPWSISISSLPPEVDPSSTIEVYDYLIDLATSGDLMARGRPEIAADLPYPAATGMHRMGEGKNAMIFRETVIAHDGWYAVVLVMCVEPMWPYYQRQVEAMLRSIEFWMPDPQEDTGFYIFPNNFQLILSLDVGRTADG